jgi:hypothetical protein
VQDNSTETTTVANGSISNATTTSLLCLAGDFQMAFYSVVGTGHRMRVSTCTPEVALTFKSVIHVDTGVCDSLACSSWMNDPDVPVACENSPTGFASTVEWETETDTLYTISVRGLTADQRGDFGLSLQAFGNVTQEGDGCQSGEGCGAPSMSPTDVPTSAVTDAVVDSLASQAYSFPLYWIFRSTLAIALIILT